ncbi:MAG TPA: hypothetical protein VFP50_19530 [Anaeromyxobacteraceae bacterium]|nr:hypothetical protein [Anaeromyxobacteraceae bacterium]
MKLTNNTKLEHLMGELRRGYGLQEERNREEAQKVYRGVVEEARRLGFESGFALWNLAIVSDYAGELDMAFDYIMQAIAADPLARPFRDSFDVIAEAVTLLHPAEPAAWLCKAEAARAAGQLDVAALASAEAAALDGAPVPFAVPGVARG